LLQGAVTSFGYLAGADHGASVPTAMHPFAPPSYARRSGSCLIGFSHEHPYGTSLLGAGTVHHIKAHIQERGLGVKLTDTSDGRQSDFALAVLLRFPRFRPNWRAVTVVNQLGILR
jgi:hypothetical protein